MPDTTPLGITYPCSGETIDPAVLRTYAISTQAALAAQDALVDDVLFPPAAQVRVPNVSPALVIAAGVSTPVPWTLENFDGDGMWSVVAPTQLVIQEPGTYHVASSLAQLATPTTGLSLRQSILLNGSERAFNKSDAGTGAFGYAAPQWVSGLLISLVPLDVVTVNVLFTGTGNMTVYVTTSIIRISAV